MLNQSEARGKCSSWTETGRDADDLTREFDTLIQQYEQLGKQAFCAVVLRLLATLLTTAEQITKQPFVTNIIIILDTRCWI